jgi:hypothetical protein
MKRYTKPIELAACTLLCLVCLAPLARAEESGLSTDSSIDDPRLLAKIARTKAKQAPLLAAENGNGSGNGSSSPNCGGVDIGNITVPQGAGVGPREVTVVITGDVINANNKCK